VNTTDDCERARMALMASIDGESDAPRDEHFSTCASCQLWLKDLQSMTRQLQGLPYPDARVDLWMAVEGQIRHAEERRSLPRALWPVLGIVFAWRTLQLFFDLPLPALHPLLPLAAGLAILWRLAGDPLAIQTSAPELEN
jgi:hypothetical protein